MQVRTHIKSFMRKARLTLDTFGILREHEALWKKKKTTTVPVTIAYSVNYYIKGITLESSLLYLQLCTSLFDASSFVFLLFALPYSFVCLRYGFQYSDEVCKTTNKTAIIPFIL